MEYPNSHAKSSNLHENKDNKNKDVKNRPSFNNPLENPPLLQVIFNQIHDFIVTASQR